jgi:putative Mg2+ transporter-C (MgtC) family protein
MEFNYEFILDNSIKLGVSLVLGALMGAEREYKGRNIGFRTIILITLGSTLFTIISIVMGEDGDPTRIASNIVTGVGFLGAGAIFRDGFSVKGVTTASLIWISAAIGMSCGIGQYEFALMVTATVLVVLVGFSGVQKFIDRYNKELVYRIKMENDFEIRKQVESRLHDCQLKFEIISYNKENGAITLQYEARGSHVNHEKFVNFLTGEASVTSFSV